MMTSFLAHLEGGVSMLESETTRESGARERALKGRAGLRARLFPLGDAEGSVEGSHQKREETSFESQTERHHTAASLFNLLYSYLQEDGQLVVLKRGNDLSDLQSGQLVELSGEYLGNPLEELLAFFGTVLPYVQEQEEVQRKTLEAAAESAQKTAKTAKRSGNPATRAGVQETLDAADALIALTGGAADTEQEFGVRMILRMIEDISAAVVHDVLFRTRGGLDAVVTVNSEFYSVTTNEHLRAGEFRLVGKVTRVLTEGESINLTRRTVLGAAGPTVAQGIVGSVQETDFKLEVADPIVNGPAVQIFPMAIFI